MYTEILATKENAAGYHASLVRTTSPLGENPTYCARLWENGYPAHPTKCRSFLSLHNATKHYENL